MGSFESKPEISKSGASKEVSKSAPDPEVEQYIDSGFHDRLRQDWPEDGEQLHSGGWTMTKTLMAQLASYLEAHDIQDARFLDLCCGEGSTPIFYAKEKGWNQIGIDINEVAIAKANEATKAENVQGEVSFVAGSAFEMPFGGEEFHIIYGQDPDAMATSQRPKCLNECFRVLKPGGILAFHHHWIPGRGWDPKVLEKYREESGSDNVNAEMYISDLKEAGFEIQVAQDITELASKHLHDQFERMKERVANSNGQASIQNWLKVTVDYLDQGKPFGIRIVAVKPK